MAHIAALTPPAFCSFGLQLVKAAGEDVCVDCSEASSGPDPNPDSDRDPATWDCDLFMTVGARLSPEDGAGSGAVAVHMASAVAVAKGHVQVRGSCVVPGAHFMAEASSVRYLHQRGSMNARHLRCTQQGVQLPHNSC